MRRCEILASPIKVGKLTLKNKMMTTSMSPCRGYIENEAPTIQMLNYMEERAAGGLGLMCQTVLPFTRKDRPEGLPPVHPLPGAYDEDCLPPWRRSCIATTVFWSDSRGSFMTGSPMTSTLKSPGRRPT